MTATSAQKQKPKIAAGNGKTVEVPATITVRDLAKLMSTSPIEIIKELMNNGIMANINQLIDFDTAAIIGGEMGYEVVPPYVEETQSQPEEKALPLGKRLIAAEDPKKA